MTSMAVRFRTSIHRSGLQETLKRYQKFTSLQVLALRAGLQFYKKSNFAY